MSTRRAYPLRWLLLAPAILVMLGMALGVGALSWRAARVSSESVEQRLVEEIASGVEQHLQGLLRSAHDVVQENAGAFRLGLLPLEPPARLQQRLLNQIRHQPHLTFISIGLPDGGLISASRHPVDGGLRLITAERGGPLTRYRVLDEGSGRTELEDRGEPYDSRSLVWYQRAAQSGELGWYPVVAYRSYASLGLGLSAPLRSAQGQGPLGVAGADLGLVQLSRFLAARFAGRSGLAFVAEQDGQLLASSTEADAQYTPIRLDQRQLAQQADPRLRAVADWIGRQGKRTEATNRPVKLQVEGRYYLLNLREVRGAGGLELLQGVLLEEDALLGSWRAQARWALIWVLALALLAIGLLFALLTRLVRELDTLGQAAGGLALGQGGVRVPEDGPILELRRLGALFNHMGVQVQRSLSTLKGEVSTRSDELALAQAELQRQLALDSLTQIANRGRFEEELDKAWRRAQRQSQALALLVLDVDAFKLYNERHGQVAGDTLLRGLAELLEGMQRRPDDLAARLSADRFVLLLPGTDPQGAAQEAEELLLRVRARGWPQAPGAPASTVSISIGVAIAWPDDVDSPAGLLQRAEHSLAAAKSGGRNRWVCLSA
ncbi:diguanylate cyclase domain-containing protein [Inhella sp.]|uniref:sensor domain-containing diguanylate cyclase n=1 Tax=Inhella sp. TaxID=1921806 RepID=UPI0035AEBE17